MSLTRDGIVAAHDQVLAIVSKHLDPHTLEIVKSALASDERMAVIRDAFLEGRDHEAVHMLRELDPTGMRILLPMSANVPIQPNQSAQITARPQIAPFKPTHILVSKTCAADFDINDIRVGARSQFAQSGDVPADAFEVDSVAFDSMLETHVANEEAEPLVRLIIEQPASRVLQLLPPLDLEPVLVAMDLVIVVTNRSEQPVPWRAAWLGEVKAR